MAEKYGFFDSVLGDAREYTADEWAEIFGQLLTPGILVNQNYAQDSNLKVTAGQGLNISVAAGMAILEKFRYYINTASLTLTANTSISERKDRVILRLDKSLNSRSINAMILQGTGATAPDLTRSGDVYDIGLAIITISNGAITQVTDTRTDSTVCGIVNSMITLDFEDICDRVEALYNNRVSTIEDTYSKMLIGSLINTVVGAEETHTIAVPIGTNRVRIRIVFLQNGSSLTGFLDACIQEGTITMFGTYSASSLSVRALPPSTSVECEWSDNRYAKISNVVLDSIIGQLSFNLKFNSYLATATYSVECYKQ